MPNTSKLVEIDHVREKLSELVFYAENVLPLPDGVECEELVADHLIANGVTIPVRCGECKYFVCADDKFEQHCRLYGAAVEEDEFCSAGERKDYETD